MDFPDQLHVRQIRDDNPLDPDAVPQDTLPIESSDALVTPDEERGGASTRDGAPYIKETIAELMSTLSNESKVDAVKRRQEAALENLHTVKNKLVAINKESNTQYQTCVIGFLKAARQARQAKDDLNDISRRLS